MKTILVVRRPFKSQGEFYPVGSIIQDPTKIKFLRTKLTEGKVVELTADSPRLDFTIDYLELRTDEPVRAAVEEALEIKPVAAEPVKPVVKPAGKTTETTPAK